MTPQKASPFATPPTTEDLAWLAGVFDGVGSVFITRTGRSHQLRVCLYRMEGRLLDRALDTVSRFGSARWYQGAKTGRIIVVSQAAARMLVAIAPYLRGKRTQALLGASFQQRLERGHAYKGFRRGPGYRLPPTEIAQREGLRQNLRNAKQAERYGYEPVPQAGQGRAKGKKAKS